MAKGTNTTLDLLETQFADEAIVDIGFESVYDAINVGLELHRQEVGEAMSLLAEERNETTYGQFRHARYGENTSLRGRRVDEFGVVGAQKVAAGYTVGFPLDRLQFAIGWTDDYLEIATGSQLVKDFQAIRQGDFLDQRAELLNAIFDPVNTTETEDFFDHIDVSVKALVNADGAPIPEGPSGETFNGATHTHYIAAASITNAALLQLVTLVKEHYSSGTTYLFISETNRTTVEGLADFLPYTPVNIIPGIANSRVDGTKTEMLLNDRQIGEFHECIVWTKPWMPTGYVMCAIVSPRINKVVRFRRRKGGLYLKSNNKSFPLTADYMENNYGAGVYERTAAACLDATNATPAVYVKPVFT